MGLLNPPAPGSLLKTGTVKMVEPVKKKEPGAAKSANKDKGSKKAAAPEGPEESVED